MNVFKHEVFHYTLKKPEIKKLDRSLSVDVVIVGGGIAGLSAAQTFHNAGKSVVVLEKTFCGGGASGKSSGFISQDSELGLANLVDNFGEKKAKELWEFVGGGMEIIRNNIKQYSIECDYQEQDYVLLARDSHGISEFKEEYEARKKLGYQTTFYTEENIKNLIGSNQYVGGIRYPGTFGISSYLYCQAMKEVLERSGVLIFEETPATYVDGKGVTTEHFRVDAQTVFVATDLALPEFGIAPKDVYHVQTVLTASKPLSDSDIKKMFPTGGIMCADSDMIYQYFRILGNNRLLIGGGDILSTYDYTELSNPNRLVKKINRYLKKHFPDIPVEIEYVWPGLIGVSKDLVPIAGVDHSDGNIYFVSAATGLAWAAGLGKYMGEVALGKNGNLDDYFSPKRKFPLDPLARIGQSIVGTKLVFAGSHGFVTYLR